MAKQEDLFKKVISHAKEYGYIFQSSEIYDGLSAVYDYAQNGVELKKIVNGKVVIRKGKVDDEITIYFINERGRYYYLRYRNDVVSFYSNQKDIMSRFDELSSEKRSYEINGAKYMYKKESEEVVEEFIDFYM